ncbi:phosphate/phosphite/phosphonate ABC transporter substrate-binding protein [Aliiglaciecola sp. M165]|uniref:phosphate/phosphite/phosphonate ABC transporter substrate-binding protein n=1 Tax=Aliiglaciecola sp. M165 TaxID=2593649 RepID=UPI00117ECB7E|nr:PhnD/SsuA/transferrin family substrate-binding protein [Aliiglaciecola sp. M165]TRY33870.1 phosphate/phosphite/phosphonate ABC transporter substrate-binding protein [Aliiglaciecola sp. M165]
MKCTLVKYMVFALMLAVSCLAQADGSQSPILIGTYKYPGIDRAASIKPLLESVVANLNAPAVVVLFDSPSELADAFKQGQIQIAVPNLAGYLQIAFSPTIDFVLLASPDTLGSSYTSSIVTSFRGQTTLTDLRALSNKPIATVWSDSISGGLVGLAYVNTRLNNKGLSYETAYVGSHVNVFKGVAELSFEFGILATKVFLEESKKNPGKVSEVWRSSIIPFGPLVCAIEPLSSCLRLQHILIKNAKESEKILEGLKKGWPEFGNSTTFVRVEKSDLEPLVRILKQL